MTEKPASRAAEGAAERAAEKAALRRHLLAARAARPADEVRACGRALAALLDAVLAELRPAVVAAYVGIGTEPPTLPLLDRLVAGGVGVLLPRLLPDLDLDWAPYDGAAGLVPGRFGLREPAGPGLGTAAIATADLVLAPALAVDVRGHRLGRGGGSFDRALDRARPDATVLAVVYAEEVLDAVPVEAHDRSVQGALTPHGRVSAGSE